MVKFSVYLNRYVFVMLAGALIIWVGLHQVSLILHWSDISISCLSCLTVSIQIMVWNCLHFIFQEMSTLIFRDDNNEKTMMKKKNQQLKNIFC